MLLFACLAILATSVWADVVDPNVVCMQLEDRRNHKDVYPKEGDCHVYYQCYYSGNTEAIGVARRCQDGTFFDPSTLHCVKEGPVPCTRLYEITSERARLSETSCRDTFGNILHSDPKRTDLFLLKDMTLSCPNGRSFDLDTCQCDNSDAEPIARNPKKQCQLWMPFDEDMLDHSYEKFLTFPSGDAALDYVNFFNGEASLRLKHGRVRVQGIKSLDLTAIGVPNTASWCFYFRCEGPRTHDCLHEGGILSNSKDAALTDFTIVTAVRPNNKLEVRLGTTPQITTLTVPINWKQVGWNHACIVLDVNVVRTYINAELANSAPINGNMTFSHQPYFIGSDRGYGNFIGNIDDVIVCAHPFSEDEVNALYNGDHDALRREGLFP